MDTKKRWKVIGSILFFLLAGSIFVISSTKKQTAQVEFAGGNEAGEQEVSGTQGVNPTVTEMSTQQDVLQEHGDEASCENEEKELQEELYVHVCGAVEQPGVYAFFAGARVVEAIAAAGGFTKEADRDYLNQARMLTDGEKLYVPNQEEAAKLLEETGKIIPQEPAVTQQAASVQTQPTSININTATLAQFMTLSGIGQAKAEAILAYRSEHGTFQSCEELMQVPGIKESLYEKIKDNITTGD